MFFSLTAFGPRAASAPFGRIIKEAPYLANAVVLYNSLGRQALKEALIKSLFAFILEFLCNVRNGLTRIAGYLRRPMTKQCIKILIKGNSMN